MHKQNLYLIQIDNKSCKQKPNGSVIGQIKKRVQGSEPKLVTLEQLKRIIESGVTFSPGILKGGLKAENWVQQQIFCVDIDNDEDNIPIMSISEALQICEKHKIEPLLYYPSFSDTTEKPKFRLIFAMDEIITNPSKRAFIAQTMVSLIPQPDKSCVNADRIFFGTDKEVKIYDN